mmetsp:Transcript_32758/g.71550  ORF Transcript_32758/g.71550 Transcript_32758/m.71550 type:complete len:394 (+) Transcript_32758:65-1246(+)
MLRGRPSRGAVPCQIFLAVSLAQALTHEQCKDPLFETHWAGKNDIQTLKAFPTVKTNLKLCPMYNQKASCCHQTFESEQRKYYDFWRKSFEEKLMRMDVHRQAMVAAARQLPDMAQSDREQYAAALARYGEVLSPTPHQEQCFSSLLTYVAGMICFGCKVEWFHYTVLAGGTAGKSLEHVVRVREARTVCLQLWATCEKFAGAATRLDAALRDSAVARSVPRALEDLSMFTGQQQFCDWMHDQVALHPFRLPTKEAEDIAPWPGAAASAASGAASAASGAASAASGAAIAASGAASAASGAASTASGAESAASGAASTAAAAVASARRLNELGPKKEFDVMWEGRASGFDRTWRNPFGPVSSQGRGAAAPGLVAAAALGAVFGAEMALGAHSA